MLALGRAQINLPDGMYVEISALVALENAYVFNRFPCLIHPSDAIIERFPTIPEIVQRPLSFMRCCVCCDGHERPFAANLAYAFVQPSTPHSLIDASAVLARPHPTASARHQKLITQRALTYQNTAEIFAVGFHIMLTSFTLVLKGSSSLRSTKKARFRGLKLLCYSSIAISTTFRWNAAKLLSILAVSNALR